MEKKNKQHFKIEQNLRIFPPETITTLLIGYTPIQNEEFLKKGIFPILRDYI